MQFFEENGYDVQTNFTHNFQQRKIRKLDGIEKMYKGTFNQVYHITKNGSNKTTKVNFISNTIYNQNGNPLSNKIYIKKKVKKVKFEHCPLAAKRDTFYQFCDKVIESKEVYSNNFGDIL
jgi:hypothetical protein